MNRLHFLLDENLPLPKTFSQFQEKHNIIHANFLGLRGKDDKCVYMESKKRKSILITYDENIYHDCRKYRYFKDVGLIYLTSRKRSCDLLSNEIEARFKKLFRVVNRREQYYNTKMKLSDNQVEIKNPNGRIQIIRF